MLVILPSAIANNTWNCRTIIIIILLLMGEQFLKVVPEDALRFFSSGLLVDLWQFISIANIRCLLLQVLSRSWDDMPYQRLFISRNSNRDFWLKKEQPDLT
ncbi:uncharacterized protein LOC129882814 isoform X2 [Solanum dulcamara]|uniref:uncharacterized protein LOC129882814 isoform X2 n=1 Tax=Solanum dulcamara TaxID=45834 RepID=UPI0024865B85|nr:uncharacterized protein LOC129882814 isoform X2 [Solanum dulcamara]